MDRCADLSAGELSPRNEADLAAHIGRTRARQRAGDHGRAVDVAQARGRPFLGDRRGQWSSDAVHGLAVIGDGAIGVSDQASQSA